MSYKGGRTSAASTTHSQILISEMNDYRKRQSKKDEAIRRKLEHDLSKKKRSFNFSKNSSRSKVTPGSVLSLKPSEPIICSPKTTVLEASKIMSAKRINCMLVVADDNKQLIGIFTAKDLAFRVVANNQIAGFVSVEEIMTKNPLCVLSSSPASEALNLMVKRRFRHLPIQDSEGQIIGILDITKCYQDAMDKLQRMYDSSKKLYDALDDVNQEMGISQQPSQVMKYFESLKKLMGGPTLKSILDDTTLPVYTNVKSSVLEAAVLMKEHGTTAILIKDAKDEEVTGIFTSKDVVLRVIAAGLDPKTCSVVRVMTPSPDCASKDLTIHEALKQMFDGHYLNLPIVDDNEIIGIVEVLKLTYATLNRLKFINSDDYGEFGTDDVSAASGSNVDSNPENPIWNRFWTALDDSDYSYSETESRRAASADHSSKFHNEVQPNDSISCVNQEDGKSSIATRLATGVGSVTYSESSTFNFKFKSPMKRIHRITMNPEEGTAVLRALITQKLSTQDLKKTTESYAISYKDDEGDLVAVTTDQDLIDCVQINKVLGLNKADLFIHNPEDSLEKILEELEQLDSNIKNKHSNNNLYSLERLNTNEDTFIPGIPNQLLVPGAIITLAASIVAAFAFASNRR